MSGPSRSAPPSAVSGTVSVVSYGAKGDGVADDTAAIQAAIAAVAGGGEVYFPPGTYKVTATIAPPNDVVLRGASWTVSKLIKGADVIVLDLSGTADAGLVAGGDVSKMRKRVRVQRLGLDGANNAAWTAPLTRCYYATLLDLDIAWANNFGPAIVGVQWWDSVIRATARVDNCGKGDGTMPPVWIKNIDAGATSGQFGFSADNSNNIKAEVGFTIEGCRDGGLFIDGRAANGSSTGPRPNKMRLPSLKVENVAGTINAPLVRVLHANGISFHDLNVTGGSRSSGADVNWIEVQDSYGVDFFGQTLVETVAGSTQAIRAGLAFVGGNDMCGFDCLRGLIGGDPNNKPSVGLLDHTGTNTNIWRGRHQYMGIATAAPLRGGGASTSETFNLRMGSGDISWGGNTNLFNGTNGGWLESSGRIRGDDGVITRVKAGAISDADFTGTIADGLIAADSTGNFIYVRLGGLWKKVAVA